MLDTVRAIFSLLTSYGLLIMANGLFNTLLGVRTKIEGFSTETVGVIMAAYFAGLLIGAFQSVRVVAAVGHIRAFAAFASVMSITALTHVLFIDPVAWAFMRLVSGLCMAGMVLVTESWLNVRATNANRGQVMALYMTTNYFAAGCGQLLLPMANPAHFELFSVASIIFSVALVPVLVTRADAPTPEPRARLHPGELWRTSPLGFMGALCAGLVNSVFFGLGAVFAHGIGLTVADTARFMASAVFGGLLLQWPVGRISDRIDRRWVLAGVALATSASALAIFSVAGTDSRLLYGFAVIYGGLSFTVYSISAAHANDFSDPGQRMRTASGLLVAYGIGACVGPVLAATIMGQVGSRDMFAYSASVSGFLGLFAIYRMRRRAAPPVAERGQVINLPGGQFTAGQLQTTLRDEMDRDLARMSGGTRGPRPSRDMG